MEKDFDRQKVRTKNEPNLELADNTLLGDFICKLSTAVNKNCSLSTDIEGIVGLIAPMDESEITIHDKIDDYYVINRLNDLLFIIESANRTLDNTLNTLHKIVPNK